MNDTKLCNKCNTIKLLTEFPKNKYSPDGIKSKCRECERAYYREYRERYKKQAKEWMKANPRKRSIIATCSRVRIKYKDYLILAEKQGNVCKICKQPNATKTKSRLCLDHCHKTGKVRGLLCDSCNKGLGNFKDNINLLSNALEYLKE